MDKNGRPRRFNGQTAIIDKQTQNTISIVSDSYKFISNREAFEFADDIIIKIFGNRFSPHDFKPYNIRMSKSKGNCRIDLIIPYDNKQAFPELKDSWIPFVRISNSYNRTLVLKR